MSLEVSPLFDTSQRFYFASSADLLDILLEEPEREALVELDLLGVPLALQLPVVRQDLVDHFQHVARPLLQINIVRHLSHELHQNHRYSLVKIAVPTILVKIVGLQLRTSATPQVYFLKRT